jgi:hypothetical protein
MHRLNVRRLAVPGWRKQGEVQQQCRMWFNLHSHLFVFVI